MQIVTLITDLGQEDYYVGLLKGSLLSQYSQLNCIDISHNIKNFNIVHAAFILKNCYPEYPTRSIHLVNVMAYYQQKPNFIIFKKNGHYFVGPDNGIFSLAFDEPIEDVRILESEEGVFAFRKAYAKAIAHISQGLPLEKIGSPHPHPVRRINLQPIVTHGQLRASIIHVDTYGNVILNITRRLFQQVCQGRKFALFFKRHEPITQINEYYSDVPVGDLVGLFNSAGHLEIALNMDNLSEKYGLRVEDAVILKWEQ